MSTPDRSGALRRVSDAEQILSTGGDPKRAETAYRQALRLDPASAEAAFGLSELLRQLGRLNEALAVTAPMIVNAPAPHAALAAHAKTLKELGRSDEALAAYRRAALENPQSSIAIHNLAGAHGDRSEFEQAAAMARKALEAGVDSPETWLVLARALQGLGQLDKSEAGFYEVLTRNPRNADAQRELAQLIWMKSGDVEAALKPLDVALMTGGPDPRLMEIRAIALKFCGEVPRAREAIERAAQLFPGDAAVEVTAAHLSILDGDTTAGLNHARAAAAAAPKSLWTRLCVCEALLAIGEAGRALTLINELRAAAPRDQNIIAYQATAWRMLDDERYHALFDYDALVSNSQLDTPNGWSSLDDYLADLTKALEARHVFQTHPFQQSLRHGTQISNLTSSDDPAIRAFFEAVAGPIRRRLETMGKGGDPLRSRNTGKSQFEGVWSVRLQGGAGRHVDHVHHKGWLSSACYIDLPAGIAGSTDREGWLKFGEPGIKTEPHLPAEYFVEPKPGHLVLFPSYMWHGTQTFTGTGARLTVAFDLLPA